MVKKRFRAAAIAAALALFAVCGLAACGPADTAAPADDAGKAPVTVRVASMKGHLHRPPRPHGQGRRRRRPRALLL